jgi:hypothetical protein
MGKGVLPNRSFIIDSPTLSQLVTWSNETHTFFSALRTMLRVFPDGVVAQWISVVPPSSFNERKISPLS